MNQDEKKVPEKQASEAANSEETANNQPQENEVKAEDAVQENAGEWKKKYDELYDKYLRTLAEYDNFKKRTAKEKDELYSYAVADTLEKLLPVLDNLERAVDAAEEKSPLADGVKMVLKQFADTLEKMDVAAIEAVGGEFDPKLHNAVMHVEDENVGANTVVEEFQKGYKYKEKVIRHSMVKVAN